MYACMHVVRVCMHIYMCVMCMRVSVYNVCCGRHACLWLIWNCAGVCSCTGICALCRCVYVYGWCIYIYIVIHTHTQTHALCIVCAVLYVCVQVPVCLCVSVQTCMRILYPCVCVYLRTCKTDMMNVRFYFVWGNKQIYPSLFYYAGCLGAICLYGAISVYCILSTIYYILYTIWYILYTIY